MIIVRSPLRISFAGGGTDMRDYYGHGYGAVCSMAIDKYVYVTVNNLSDYFPHRVRIAYSQTELVQDVSQIRHPIVREVVKRMELSGGFDINVMADIPAGTGMGSSSSFTVSLLHALHAFKNELISKEHLAKEASRLEVDVLKEPIGKQDQYAASFGGINLFRFQKNEQVAVEPLPMAEARLQELSGKLMVFYLGGNREASKILHEQSSNCEKNKVFLDEMRKQAELCAEILTGKHPLDDLGLLLQEGWKLKRKLAEGISNPLIEKTVEAAMNAGALGGKLLGAGGTGFLLFYVPETKKELVRQELRSFKEVSFAPDEMGSTLLYYGK